MLKTMKNQMLPERGEGCRCKGKTPKTFMYVCVLRMEREYGYTDIPYNNRKKKHLSK